MTKTTDANDIIGSRDIVASEIAQGNIAAAGCIRGFVDTVVYLIKKGVLWVAQFLESMHDWIVEQFGPKWWVGTPIEQFVPKR